MSEERLKVAYIAPSRRVGTACWQLWMISFGAGPADERRPVAALDRRELI